MPGKRSYKSRKGPKGRKKPKEKCDEAAESENDENENGESGEEDETDEEPAGPSPKEKKAPTKSVKDDHDKTSGSPNDDHQLMKPHTSKESPKAKKRTSNDDPIRSNDEANEPDPKQVRHNSPDIFAVAGSSTTTVNSKVKQNPESESGINVTFEVLLHEDMDIPNSTVYILFGPPLSDWQTFMVQMAKKPETDGLRGCFYLTGELNFPIRLKNRNIPYKYAVLKHDDKLIWEAIPSNIEYAETNRCLLVPKDVEDTYTKFDDIILASAIPQHQRLGRETAVNWMLPRPSDFENPRFDFDLACQRFEEIEKAFDANGTRRCLDNKFEGHLNPTGFNMNHTLKAYAEKSFNSFRQSLDSDSNATLLRKLIFICLLTTTKHLQITKEQDFLTIFKAFYICRELLFEKNNLPKTISPDIQNLLVDQLKTLVKDFANLHDTRSRDLERAGDWFYVLPFIHHWDQFEDPKWLNLDKWKQQLKTRSYSALKYLEFVSLMKSVDLKIDEAFLKMLEPEEMEKILKDKENIRIFKPSQLLKMFKSTINQASDIQASDINKISQNIISVFQVEVDEMKTRAATNEGKLTVDDSRQVQDWSKQMNSLLSQRDIKGMKKKALISLVLDIAIMGSDSWANNDNVKDISRSISANLSGQSILAEEWTIFLKKLSILDKDLHAELLERFKCNIHNLEPAKCLDILISGDDQISTEVADVLFERAILVFKSQDSFASKAINWAKSFIGIDNNEWRKHNLARLFSKCLGDVKDDKELTEVIEAVTKTPAVSNMMKFYPKLLDLRAIQEETKRKAEFILGQVYLFFTLINDGSLSLHGLQLIRDEEMWNHLISLNEIYEQIQNTSQVSQEYRNNIRRRRLSELDAYYQAQTDLSDFIKSSNSSEDLQTEILSQFCIDPSSTQLSKVCYIDEDLQKPIVLKLQHVSRTQLEIVRKRNDLYAKSNIFRQIQEPFEDIVSTTWENLIRSAEDALEHFNEFVDQLFTLEIKIGQVNERFLNVYNNGRLTDELRILEEVSSKNGLARKVEDSIMQLFTLGQHQNIALAIQKASTVLGRSSNFQHVKNILSAAKSDVEFQDQQLSSLSKDLVKAGKYFKNWKSEQIDVLQSLEKSQSLLKWLKENIKDRGDLKTFYELASISAGESDHEVDRVLHFYQAVSAYAPLILDLKMINCSFADFLEACNKVFEALERDPKIAVKLRESSNRNLEWIKACKDQQGSVEQSSLSLVNKINQTGIFVISVPTNKEQSRGQVTEEQYIKLKYKKVGEEFESLSLEELQELRSKLMLITTGTEGKKEVERFVRILCLVELVAQQLMALVKAGCYMFTKWKLWAVCDPNSKVKLRSDLGQFGGLHHGLNDVENELNQMATFLKKTVEDWSQHVFDLRNSRQSLNFFTTDQLITLSVKLAYLMNKGTKMQPREEMLLRLINPKATSEELEEMIRNKVKHCQKIIEDSGEESDIVSDEDSDNEDSRRRNQFEELESSDAYKTLIGDLFDHDLILASLIKCGTEDLDEATAWCYELNHKPEEVQSILDGYQAQFNTENEPPKNIKKESKLEFAIDIADDDSLLLCEQLNHILQQFLKDVNSLEIKDHLSFLNLAECLEDLSTELKSNYKRTFSATLKEGSPNLIVCSDAEMYATTLSIFMNDPAKPMPSLDEVLICHKDTPLEKLELICRRAFSDDSGKIYIVVHAERMNYDNGLYIENLVSKTTVQNHKYRLVFIASKEVNDHSYIVTAFEKDRRQVAELPTQKDIQDYLLSHIKTSTSPDPDQLKIRMVKSKMSGNGKSLVASRLCKQLGKPKHILQLYDPKVDLERIISAWFKDHLESGAFHLDLTPAVKYGRDDLIFSIAVLGGIEDSGGQVWLSTEDQFYIIELTSVPHLCSLDPEAKQKNTVIPIEDYLPSIECVSPRETSELLSRNPGLHNEFLQGDDQAMLTYLFDHDKFRSEIFQRPFLYLNQLRNNQQNGLELDSCVYKNQPSNLNELHHCLETLLQTCSIQDPTWMELTHFASFLNAQLSSSEKSNFCDPNLVKEDFPGMKTFVVKFLIEMSKDFATRSIEVSDQSHGEGFSKPHIEDRHRWENSPHPYIFFNEDGHSMSFYGFQLDEERNLVDERSKQILEPSIMTEALHQGLHHNKVLFNKPFDDKNEASKIAELCQVLGVDSTLQNPDKSYELTSDNVMKMLAIFMRFRSNIPVVIMGETGSGKTRLIKYLCDLLREGKDLVNLLILKTHGGVTEENIYAIVTKAIKQAKSNKRIGVKLTVLFFDEANTTNAIGAIKSVMCDRLCNGVPIPDDVGLQFVAAVNPFREHSPEMIKKLEIAGLGYHIKADKTQDKLGKIPMRRLVYRVIEIPASMFPLIWDFGNLDAATERKYISQMIRTCMATQGVTIPQNIDLVDVLSRSQTFMRSRHDECSFVSLRDVERLLLTLRWFHDQTKIIANKIFQKIHSEDATSQNAILLINMILALGVTYYTRLDERRKDFENEMVKCLNLTNDYFSTVIIACQDLFIDELKLEPNIAKNDALKENVWMMAICIELRIPLFLVGKPGSSKSLAKTVITDVMQGDMSYSKDLFKHFKEIHMVSFQCSPLATAGGILSTFRQCQKFQEKRDLNRFTAVTVLDEIGLAEDSEKMPLKALHPLLEDGCVDLETPEPHKKVSFIGISNWALDPAKMNRGILLCRGVPDQKDLVKSAEGICSRDEDALRLMKGLIDQLANGYYSVYRQQEREYFGLRDFYSLVKMIHANVLRTRTKPTEEDIIYAVQRNFGGYFSNFKPAEVFLRTIYPNLNVKKFLPPKALITKAIKQEGETRYILLLTKNNAALNIIQEQSLLDMKTTSIIFGSSFIQDQEYRQICLNINRIKIAMELGHTVILCNLNNLYESLYDALNQNYVTMSDSRYVDLGLGTHRVKCRIHPNFRLVLIAEDVEVYEKFPIPLINRLEKHYLGMETMLTEETHLEFVDLLKNWLNDVSHVNLPSFKMAKHQQFSPQDVFIGYHEDAPASIILRLVNDPEVTPETLLNKAKTIFLECATPDSISRLSETGLSLVDKLSVAQEFYQIPKGSLAQAIRGYSEKHKLIQVTTFSRLLTEGAKVEICHELSLTGDAIQMISLQQVNTEEQFSKRIKSFLETTKNDPTRQKVLIVQTQINPETQTSLVECSRYSILNEILLLENEGPLSNFCIVLILQVPRVHGGFFAGFPGVQWKALHIDEIRGDENSLDVSSWNDVTLHQALQKGRYLKALIEESIPKAAALAYKSNTLSTSRITNCIEIMRKCFSSSDQSFADIICAKILRLIEQDEPSYNPKKWMADLAMGSVHLKEGNTFAKAIWLHLADKVSQHLASVLKFCDNFSGLDHVLGDKQDLYMKLLTNFEVDMPTGGATRSLSLKVPFSWAIENQLEKLYHKNGDLSSFQASFSCTEIGKILESLFDIELTSSFDFISDLAELSFGGEMSENLKEAMCKEIDKFARRLRPDNTDTDDFMETNDDFMETNDDFMETNDDLMETNHNDDDDNYMETNELDKLFSEPTEIMATDIYAAICLLKPRLRIFYAVAKIFPEVVSKIEANEDRFNIDIQAISFALDLNQPKGTVMLDNTARQEWKIKVNILSTFLSQVEGHIRKDIISTEDEDLFKEATFKNKRAKIAMLYLDHTMDADVDNAIKEVVCDKLRLLWAALRELDFVGGQKTFDEILRCINVLCIKAEEALTTKKYGIQKCLLCFETIIEALSLPCGHTGCKDCFKTHFEEASNRLCPMKDCQEVVPEDFEFKSAVDIEKAVKSHTIFRNKLSQFFLDLLQVFIFQSGEPLPHEGIINTLLSLIVSKTLPKDKSKPRTRRPSPFQGDFIDATPVIRSFVLQLLLRYNNQAEKYLEKYLEENQPFGDAQFPEMCIIFIQCVEDSILIERSDQNNFSGALKVLKSRIESTDEPEGLVKQLMNVAMDRILMKDVIQALNAYLSGEKIEATTEEFMRTAVDFVKNHPQRRNIQKYLVRLIVSKHGERFIIDWKKQAKFLDLLPHELKISGSAEIQDIFLLIDPSYKATRDALRVAWVSGNYKDLRKHAQVDNPSTLIWTLAIHHLAHVNPVKINNPQLFDLLKQQRQDVNNAWVQNEQSSDFFNGKSRQQKTVQSLLLHFQEIVTKDKLSNLLTVFRQLATSPNNVHNAFLPTMPQDESLEVKSAVRDATMWFMCAKGHSYAVGNCGAPVQKGNCPSCGSSVGSGNSLQPAVIVDETKKGHILGKPIPKERSLTLRDLSGLNVAIVRFILHSSMLIGSKLHSEEILKICHPKPQDLQEFLLDHLVLNFNQISECLGKGDNEVVLLLHQIFLRLQNAEDVRGGTLNLDTKESVRMWELEFARHCIDPVLKDVDNLIERQRLAVQEDQAGFSNIFIEILYELDRRACTQSAVLGLPQLYRSRENICLENIESKIGSKKMEAQCPFLVHLMKNQRILSEMTKLPKLVELASHLVKTFNRKFEVGELNRTTLRQFLHRHLDRKHFQVHFELFISAFNSLKDEIFRYSWVGRRVVELLNGEDVSMTSPCSIIFPASHGLGLASTVLLQFLIERHNVTVRTFNKLEEEEKQIILECQDLVDTSMLVTAKTCDLQLLLVGNSEYSLGLGEANGQTRWILNEVSLEQQCIEKFLMGKPIVNQATVPRYEYQLENLHVSDWTQLNAKIPQASSVPSKAIFFQLESELPEISDISALLSNLQTTVDTILLVGGNQNQNLAETIYKLKITSDQLPKSLRHFELKHIQPLMIQLRFVRAKRMVNNNQLPFHKAGETFLEQLPDELVASIDNLLHHVEPELVACELLDFIHERIEDNSEVGEEESEEKPLKDYFAAYLENNDSAHSNEIDDHLSDEIKMKHAISLFKIVASRIQDRS